jgi:hypothetical protein
MSNQVTGKKGSLDENDEFQSASEGELDELDEASTLPVSKRSKKNPSLEAASVLSDAVIDASYLKFHIFLNKIQILLLEDIRDLVIINDKTAMRSEAEFEALYDKYYILTPLDLFFNIHQCVYHDDVRLPAWKLFGNLPIIDFTLTDSKLENIIQLFVSIPFPKSKRENQSLEIETFEEIQGSAESYNDDLNTNEITTLRFFFNTLI